MGHSHKQFHEIMAKRAPIPELTTIDGVVLSVVYVTAEPTFTGVIGGYTTLTGDLNTEIDSQQTEDSSPTETDSSSPQITQNSNSNSQARPTQSSNSSARQSDAAGVAITSNTAAATGASTFSTSKSSSVSTGPNTHTAVASPAGSASSDGSSSSSASGDSGISTGTKAGLAVGIIAIIAILATLILYCIGKKRKQRKQYIKQDDEKPLSASNPPAPTITTTPAPVPMFPRQPPAASNAPRLSLRPVSHMMSEFGGSRTSPNPANTPMTTINEPSVFAAGATRGLAPPPQAAQRLETPNPNNPFNDPQNPFADPEKTTGPALERTPAPIPASTPAAAAQLPGSAIVPGPAAGSGPSHTQGASSISSSLASASTGGMAARAVMAAMNRNSPMNSISISNKPEPSVEEKNRDLAPAATAVLGPISAAESNPNPAQSGGEAAQGSVYRVLMDFKPSMDDELELVGGQLVRMLHEYDDGWALCIRLDRSQQGVVPRTCLATKPSKPKPSHLAQYARPPGSGSGRNSPMGRPMSPAGRPMSPQGRPHSPAGALQSRMNAPPQGMQGYNGSRQGNQNGPRQGGPMQGRPMSPGAYNQAPRPLSPGPRPQQKQRSMSPGPYGAALGPKSMTTVQRRRSNSAGAVPISDRVVSPTGLSRLRQEGPMYRSESPGIAL